MLWSSPRCGVAFKALHQQPTVTLLDGPKQCVSVHATISPIIQMNRATQISCGGYSLTGSAAPVEEKLQECESSRPEEWDHELEDDIKADRLFRLINRALRELEQAETTPL